MPLVSLLALAFGSLYLGGTVSFFSKLFWNHDLDYLLYGFLTYSHTPIGVSLAMYLGYDIFKPQIKWRVLAIFGLSGIVYLVALFGWPTQMISSTTPQPDQLIDISINSVVLIIVILYILSTMVMLGGNFLLLRRRLSDAGPRKKALEQGLGWLLFGIAGILDSTLPLNLIILPRLLMMVGYILIFEGFSPIKSEN